MAKITVTYYEPVEVQVGPVRLLALRVARREERSVEKLEEDVSRLEELLSKVVEDARRRGRGVVIEARVEHRGREAVYAEANVPGAEALLYYRPSRLKAVTLIREVSEGRLVQVRHQASGELYVYEGWVIVRDPEDKTRFVVIETEDGKRVLRRGEFRVAKS